MVFVGYHVTDVLGYVIVYFFTFGLGQHCVFHLGMHCVATRVILTSEESTYIAYMRTLA